MIKSKNNGQNMAAWILIGVGVLFLVAQTLSFSILGTFWPLFVMLPGFVFLYAALRGDRGKAGLAVPGAMITGTGLILFYQNLTNHWESWAYIWALYPVFLGLALAFIGRRTHSEDTFRTGNGFVKWGFIGFVALWALFEGFIFGGRSAVITTWLPLGLIALGIFLLFQRGTIRTGEPKKKKIVVTPPNHQPSAADINPELRKKIDEALAEPDEPQPHNN
ncbi:MAG: hypothetical protein K8L99_24295 [Anaerolineae bacterium]|nr:hypothetical protein [Anaerolineae bacterium]